MFRCNICKHEWLTRIILPIQGYGCPKCANRRTTRINQQYKITRLLALLKDKNLELVNSPKRKLLEVQCNNCEEIFTLTRKAIIRNGCPLCNNKEKMARSQHAKKLIYNGQTFKFRSASEVIIARKLFDTYGCEDVLYEYKKIKIPGRLHYSPDFFIVSKETFLEVKSVSTLGLTSYHGDPIKIFNGIQNTFSYLIARGVNIRLCVVGGRKRYSQGRILQTSTLLPLNWYKWTRRDVALFLHNRGFRLLHRVS